MIEPLREIWNALRPATVAADPDRVLEFQIFQFLRRTLTPERYRHVMGVTALAGELAGIHGVDPVRARLAGALHDVARCWDDDRLRRYAAQYRLKVLGIEFIRRHQPLILHGFVGADLARRLFGVRDKEVLSAVAKHTLAAEKMSRLEKVVYLADHLSPDRKFTGVDELRRLAREDLDRAFLESLRNKMIFILMKNQPLHPGAEKIWNRHRALLKD
jgi:nicotinate-nucleotide adenylyltransferase